jgi:5-methylcytosine-specific restriction endonuclease McrA
VCQGGTNDEANLITACSDCNLGKAGKKISQSVPNETDRLRLAQELNEQIEDAKRVKASMRLRKKRKQNLVNFWCEQTREPSANNMTIGIIFSYVEQLGEEVVYPWIERAAIKCRWNDKKMGQYISGIRRNYLLENEK